jgi:SAM-dependent methyltransferase
MNKLKKKLNKSKYLLPLVKKSNKILRKITASGHRLQYKLEWSWNKPPEWFNHFLDHYCNWSDNRMPFWVERGVFSLLSIKQGANILELSCGDGFNAKYFYSVKAEKITAIDIDPKAIKHAKSNNQENNISFIVGDIRKNLPPGPFDNVIWDAAIEHFSEEEIKQIMHSIKERLKNNGTLSGYTIVEKEDGDLSHELHQREFKSKQDLLRLLSPHFKHVKVFETIYPSRHNLYFFASNNTLPFDEDWKSQCVK